MGGAVIAAAFLGFHRSGKPLRHQDVLHAGQRHAVIAKRFLMKQLQILQCFCG
jgi:hypothetical protein